MAEALAARLPIPPDVGEAPLIIAVPLHPNRARWRGYNQAVLLANALAARVGWRTAHEALVRRRDTRPQVGLRAAERWHNMKGAFHAEKETVAGQEVLLVDDVFTTGATLSAAAEALHQAQGTAVWAVTLACAL